jgi:hypothetical protein
MTIPGAGSPHMRLLHAPDPRRPGLLEDVARMVLGGRRLLSIGGDTFQYSFDRAVDNLDESAWLLIFYRASALLAILSSDKRKGA